MAALPPGGAQICHKGALLECQLRGPMLLRKQCLPKALNERATRAMGRWRLSACVCVCGGKPNSTFLTLLLNTSRICWY